MPKGDKIILKADIDDGYTRISNTLLVAVALSRLSGLKVRAMLYLWRQTYGWIDNNKKHKKEARITLSEWAGALNTCRTNAHKALKSLENNKVLKQKSIGKGKSIIYATNTYISEWSCVNNEMLAKQLNVVSEETDTSVSHMADSLLVKSLTPLDTKSASTKEILKENSKEIILKKVSSNKKYGEFNNVSLSDNEYQKLMDKFGEDGTKERIETLSAAIASKGYKYKSHYATILLWDSQDSKKKGPGKELSTTEELVKAWEL